jgi:site-specific DNA recombinase
VFVAARHRGRGTGRELVQLHARHGDLEADLANQPEPPSPDLIDKIRNYLSTIMTSGTPTECKAAIEALIHEVKLTDQGVRPMFKIPTNDTPLPDGSHEEEEGAPVRTMVRSVEPRGLEPLTPTLPVWCATSCATAP